jgi:hypothetical protein
LEDDAVLAASNSKGISAAQNSSRRELFNLIVSLTSVTPFLCAMLSLSFCAAKSHSN